MKEKPRTWRGLQPRRRRPGPKTGKASYHHGNLRSAVLDRVRDIIRERGIGFVSVREAARRLGVSHGAPAHHFPNKRALLTAFASQGYAHLSDTIMAEMMAAAPTSGAQTLEAVGRGYVRFALGFPEHFSIMFHVDALDRADPDLVRASESAYGALMAAIGRCAVEGALGDRDPELVAVSAWSIVHGLASLWLSGRLSDRLRDPDAEKLAAAVSRLFVEAVVRS